MERVNPCGLLLIMPRKLTENSSVVAAGQMMGAKSKEVVVIKFSKVKYLDNVGVSKVVIKD